MINDIGSLWTWYIIICWPRDKVWYTRYVLFILPSQSKTYTYKMFISQGIQNAHHRTHLNWLVVSWPYTTEKMTGTTLTTTQLAWILPMSTKTTSTHEKHPLKAERIARAPMMTILSKKWVLQTHLLAPRPRWSAPERHIWLGTLVRLWIIRWEGSNETGCWIIDF